MRVNEIFSSIQGEGVLTGFETIFVRFSGCNLRCEWCDTSYHDETWVEMTPIEVFNKILKTDACQLITFTGGEPLIQDEDELAELIGLLHSKGKFVSVETNGTILTNLMFDLVTTSPKLSSAENIKQDNVVGALFVEYQELLNIKFVIGSNQDAIDAKNLLLDVYKTCHEYPQVVIQPLSGASIITTMMYINEEWDLSFKTEVKPRFMIQLHKLEGLR